MSNGSIFKGVSLWAIAWAAAANEPSISNVQIRQNWPWSREVTVDYTLTCEPVQSVDIKVEGLYGTSSSVIRARSLSGDVKAGGPNSNKLVFTASAHHAHTFGSLVLIDPTQGMELNRPIKRLPPEVPYPRRDLQIPGRCAMTPWSSRFRRGVACVATPRGGKIHKPPSSILPFLHARVMSDSPVGEVERACGPLRVPAPTWEPQPRRVERPGQVPS